MSFSSIEHIGINKRQNFLIDSALKEEKKLSNSERVNSLMAKIQVSSFFSADEQLLFKQWNEEISAARFDRHDAISMKLSSIALGFLLVDHIKPALHKDYISDQRSELVGFKKELEALIRLRLPEDVAFKDFIDNCKSFSQLVVMYNCIVTKLWTSHLALKNRDSTL